MSFEEYTAEVGTAWVGEWLRTPHVDYCVSHKCHAVNENTTEFSCADCSVGSISSTLDLDGPCVRVGEWMHAWKALSVLERECS